MYKINKIETFLKLLEKFFIINKTSSFLIYMLYLYSTDIYIIEDN